MRVFWALVAGLAILALAFGLQGCGSSPRVIPVTHGVPQNAMRQLYLNDFRVNDTPLTPAQAAMDFGPAGSDASSAAYGTNGEGETEVVLVYTPAGMTLLQAAAKQSGLEVQDIFGDVIPGTTVIIQALSGGATVFITGAETDFGPGL